MKKGVLFIAEGKGWAGIEAHLYNLLCCINKDNSLKIICVLLYDGVLAHRLREQGINVICMARRRRLDILVLYNLKRIISQYKVKIIHMHGYLAVFYGMLSSIGADVKRVATIHQPAKSRKEIGDPKFWIYLKVAYGLAKWKRATLIAVSEDVKETWVRVHKVNPYAFRVIHNGIDPGRFRTDPNHNTEIRRAMRLEEKVKIVSLVGRLELVKGHQYFIEAAKLVAAREQNVVFLVVGGGKLKGYLESFVDKLGMKDKVIFTGFKSNAADYIAISDVLVISSLYEGIPYTLLEAMSLKKAIVATEVGGLVETLDDGENALFVRPMDSSAIANSVLELLRNERKRKTMGERAFRRVSERFSLNGMVQRIIEECYR